MKKVISAWNVLLCWVVVLTILYSTLSILRHNHFESGGFDLGLYDQSVWQYSKFLYPFNTIKDRFILGDHLTLTLPLLSPLFYIWDDVRMLLIAQSAWISFSAFAAYGLARHRKFSPLLSLLIAFVYSLFYGIQYAVFFDFHPIIFGVGLLAWFVYFFETLRRKLFYLTLVLVLATQENMGIALAGLGLIYFFHKTYRRWVVFFIFIGLLSSFAASRIITLFSPVGFEYTPQIAFTPTLFWQYIDSPEKREVWFLTLTSFGFLPIFSLGAAAAVLLDISQYFLTGPHFLQMWTPFKHHRAILSVFLVMGTLDVLSWLREKHYRLGPFVLWMLGLTVFLQFFFHYPLNKLTKSAYWQSEPWMADTQKLLESVPLEASVATQQNLVPHLSHRKEIYLIWPRWHDYDDNRCGQRQCWWLDFSGKPQYLVVDLRPDQWLTQILETNEHFDAAVTNMEKAGRIQLKQSVGYARLYRISY